MSTLEMIKTRARRIARLGAYLENPYGPTAKKKKGVLHMTQELLSPHVLMCELRSGRVWECEVGADAERVALAEADALKRLAEFERKITAAVERQVRHEVLDDLVKRRMRRITATKSRELKTDPKGLKSKK